MLKAVLAVMVIAIALSAQAAHAQWDDCRFGEEDCTGQCGAFTDTDGDGICDRSQPAPQDRAAEVVGVQEDVLSLQGPSGGAAPLQNEPSQQKAYHLLEITGLLAVAYAGTYALARKGKITLLAHRKLWNVFLLATFLVVGAFGLLLVARIDYGWAPLPHFFMLQWHVDVGIAMSVISIFHVAWHWRYYACIFRRDGGKKCRR